MRRSPAEESLTISRQGASRIHQEGSIITAGASRKDEGKMKKEEE
jgi:hypothetical protein